MSVVGNSPRLSLRVTDLRCEARDVMALELRDAAGRELPSFTAGSHLEVYLPGPLVRHYSLCNDPAERDRYWIGVGLAPAGRGGSRFIHHNVRVGSTLEVSPPRNNFPLDPAAEETVLVAGGIGITPILSMVRTLERERKPWQLHYCARSRQRTAFYEELCAMAPERCRFHFDDENQGLVLDVESVLSSVSERTHVYCCGPGPLMDAVAKATRRLPDSQVHFEYFTPKVVETSEARGFAVIVKSTGQRFDVPADKTILEVLEANGHGVPFSCREGLCGTCLTDVSAGIPDHRDSVLSAAERASNKKMTVCCSRALSETLELDL